jgi:hypothetical protein
MEGLIVNLLKMLQNLRFIALVEVLIIGEMRRRSYLGDRICKRREE